MSSWLGRVVGDVQHGLGHQMGLDLNLGPVTY